MTDAPHPDYGLLDRAGAAAIFFPRRDASPPPAGATDHRLEVESGVAVGARFYARDPAWPTILYFHGNGEVASEHDDIAPLYHETGCNFFVADFRGYGQSDGEPSMVHLVGDGPPVAEQFHAILDAGGFAAARFVMGRSLGSQPALEIAARAAGRFRGLIIESGAASARRYLNRLGLDETGDAATLVAEHEAKIRTIQLPALLIHGEQDELVPLAQAVELRDLLADVDPQLVVIPNAGHNDLLWRGLAAYFTAIRTMIGGTGAQNDRRAGD
jgi:pimeloyl-ACP methyl ester carboxylesterase